MTTGRQVTRSIVSTAIGAAPGLAWLASMGTAYPALIAVLGGLIGLGLSWPGVSAGRVARGVAEILVPWAGESGRPGPPEGPYTPEDFPCPDPMPGRGRYHDPAQEGYEVPFAVVVPRATATAQELRVIGLRLQAWRAEHPSARRILGLEPLLEGRSPETPAHLLGLPSPPWVEPVALVYVDCSVATAQTGEDLCRGLECSGVAMIVSPEYYTHTHR
jgi:hypothetical protein